MLTPSLPLSRSLDLPVCLARFPSARLWLRDESLEDSANLAGLSSMPGFPRHTQSLDASRRIVGSRCLRAVRAQSTLDPRHHRRRNSRRSSDVARLWRDKPSRPRPIEIRSLPTLAHCFWSAHSSHRPESPVSQLYLDRSHCPCLRQLPKLRCRLPARFPIATCSISLIPFAAFPYSYQPMNWFCKSTLALPR